MASEQHLEDRKPRILTKEKIASLNDDDLLAYKRAVGLRLRHEKRQCHFVPTAAEQGEINNYTYAFRESEREMKRRGLGDGDG